MSNSPFYHSAFYRWCVVTLSTTLLSGVIALVGQAWFSSVTPSHGPLVLLLWRHLFQFFSVESIYRCLQGLGSIFSLSVLLALACYVKQYPLRSQFFRRLSALLFSSWCVVWFAMWVACYTWHFFSLFNLQFLTISPLSENAQSALQAFALWWVSLWNSLLVGVLWGVGCFVIIFLVRWLSLRYLSALWVNRVLPYFTKSVREEGGLTDIRTVHEQLPKIRTHYNPSDYFQQERKEKKSEKGKKKQKEQLFFGLMDQNKPLRLSRSAWFENHVHILGATGMGKTLAACNLLVQCMGFGDAVLVMEGKRDQWAPHVLNNAAEACGRPFYFIDLNDSSPQFNLLKGVNSAHLTELFDAGFALGNLGLPSDHYKKWDRKLARVVARYHEGDQCIRELTHRVMVDADETLADLRKAAQGFCLSLEEIAAIGCLKTRGGVDFQQAIREKAVVYVVGSLRDEAILALQKMILLRWMQCIETINYPTLQQRVVLFLDEFTTMLSKPALQGVSTIRDKGGQMLLAHQSMGNLKLKTPDMTAESVQSTIQSNTAIKLFFKVHDRAEQQLMSHATNDIVIPQATQHIIRNSALSEQILAEKRITERHRSLITPEMIAAMPPHYAMVMGVAPTATITAWAPYWVEKQALTITEAPALSVAKPLDGAPKQRVLQSSQAKRALGDCPAIPKPRPLSVKPRSDQNTQEV